MALCALGQKFSITITAIWPYGQLHIANDGISVFGTIDKFLCSITLRGVETEKSQRSLSAKSIPRARVGFQKNPRYLHVPRPADYSYAKISTWLSCLAAGLTYSTEHSITRPSGGESQVG